jgi:hypothetical protein
MKRLPCLLVLILICLCFEKTAAQKKSAQRLVVMHAKPAAKNRGANPYIIADIPVTDSPEIKSRSSTLCAVTLDNWTGLQIKVYIDGKYQSTIDAWGRVTVYCDTGYTTVYCISIGGAREWDASPGACCNNVSFKLQ